MGRLDDALYGYTVPVGGGNCFDNRLYNKKVQMKPNPR